MPTTYPILRWQIGDVRISRVVESEGPTSPKFLFADITKEKLLQHAWLRPHFLTEDAKLLMSIHAFVLESQGRVIVVDTCVGNDKVRQSPNWHLQKNRFLEDMAEAGFARERVTTVVCTHLHVDHVGWNTLLKDGKWTPTFPNARYLIGKKEYEHWMAAPEGETADIMNDSVKPIFDAGLAQTVDMDHRISPQIRLVPTPGHTPGHVSVMIESEGQSAVITGDMIHHPCQFARPDWQSLFDADPPAANARRHTMFEEWADKPLLVIGTHFAAPTAGHLKRDGATYRFEV
jgi:glyoxylase-like metal-dependent hydrolase (beta-lactamase superfamily II)